MFELTILYDEEKNTLSVDGPMKSNFVLWDD